MEWESGDINNLADEGIGIWDQEDWPIQHDWMGDHLEDYLRVFKPRVVKLEQEVLRDPGLRRKIEKRGRLIEYWNACAAKLVGSPIQFREGEPNAGRTYCRFEQIDTGISFGAQYYDSERSWIAPILEFPKKQEGVYVQCSRNLQKVVEPNWKPSLGRNPNGRTQSSIYTETGPESKEDWPRQHEWLREKAEKLLEEFTKRLDLN